MNTALPSFSAKIINLIDHWQPRTPQVRWVTLNQSSADIASLKALKPNIGSLQAYYDQQLDQLLGEHGKAAIESDQKLFDALRALSGSDEEAKSKKSEIDGVIKSSIDHLNAQVATLDVPAEFAHNKSDIDRLLAAHNIAARQYLQSLAAVDDKTADGYVRLRFAGSIEAVTDGIENAVIHATKVLYPLVPTLGNKAITEAVAILKGTRYGEERLGFIKLLSNINAKACELAGVNMEAAVSARG